MKREAWIKGIVVAGIVALASIVAAPSSIASSNRSAVSLGVKLFDGRTGPWISEARLQDSKALTAEARSAGKTGSISPGTYHLDLVVARLLPKTPLPVHGVKGTVMVTLPDGKQISHELASLDGHLGTDLTMAQAGDYRFAIRITEGEQAGTSTFGYTVR